MGVGGVADADRTRAHVAFQVGQRLLQGFAERPSMRYMISSEPSGSSSSQRAIIQRMKSRGLTRVAEPHESVECER